MQGLRRQHRDLGLIRDRIEEHLDHHEGYVAFSGGKDSLVTLPLALQVDPEVPVAFFDSGLEFHKTYTHLEQLANDWRLNLDVILARHTTLGSSPIPPAPGTITVHATPTHPTYTQVLILEPAATAHQRHGAGELWGVRAEESRGRAAAYANALRGQTCHCTPACSSTTQLRARHGGRIARVDTTVAYGPVWDWKTTEIWGHIARHQLPVNPVYAKLRRLGAPEHFLRVSHMVDATRLEEGRVTWLRRGWPALFEDLAAALPRLREYV